MRNFLPIAMLTLVLGMTTACATLQAQLGPILDNVNLDKVVEVLDVPEVAVQLPGAGKVSVEIEDGVLNGNITADLVRVACLGIKIVPIIGDKICGDGSEGEADTGGDSTGEDSPVSVPVEPTAANGFTLIGPLG